MKKLHLRQSPPRNSGERTKSYKNPIGLSKATLATLTKAYGEEVLTTLSHGGPGEVDEVIPTGIDALDYEIFKKGGLPVGRSIEVSGQAGVGKTTLALQIIAAAIQGGCNVTLIDSELSIEKERAEALGVDIERLLVFKSTKKNPINMEKVASYIRVLTDPKKAMKGINLIVLDSVAATALESEAADSRDTTLKAVQPGMRARLLGDLLRTVSPRLKPSRTCLFLINQIREKIGVMFGNPFTTPGGHAIRSSASVRLWMSQGERIKKDGTAIGFQINMRAEKNRFTAPWQTVPFKFLFDTGVEPHWSTIELGIHKEIIRKVKNKYEVGGKTFSLHQEKEVAKEARKLIWNLKNK